MALKQRQFFYWRAAAGISLLIIFGSLSISQTQPPAAAPPATAPPATAPSATAPAATAAAKTPNTAPVPAPAPAKAADSSPYVAQVQDLLSSLGKFDQSGRPAAQKIGFELPEITINQYLVYVLRTRPRPGLSSMKVTLSASNQVSTETEIDFDEVQKWSPGIFPELLRPLLNGKRTIKADVQFDSKEGFFNFSLKDAQGPDGKAIVNKVMMGVLQALGSRQPESVDPSKPIPLPFGLKRVWTEKQLLCGET